MLSRSIDSAIERCQFRLVAFVYMPEHVHLLIYPSNAMPEVSRFLSAVKRPYSFRIKELLQQSGSPLLDKLMIRERPGKTTFRFWQEGPGYDRNLSSEPVVLAAIDYIHLNPVRRGLCQRAVDWKWSSARRFIIPEAPPDADPPMIHGLPPEFFSAH